MNKLELNDLSDILAQSYHLNWLVEDFLERESIAMIFGEPATYKSFLAMDLAFCIGAGIDWNGKPVMQGQVIYLAGEGFSGIQKRFRALEEKYGCSQQGVFVSSKPAQLIDRSSVDEVLEAIDKQANDPVLIVIDTMHRNFGSGDENSSRDFGVFMNHLDLIKSHTKATIIFIHHPGHGGKGHSRGSSAIRGSLDAEYQVKKQGDVIELTCSKMKEFEEPASQFFKLKQVEVQVTTGMVSGAYLEEVETGALSGKVNRDTQVLNILKSMIKTNGTSIPASITTARPELAGRSWIKTEEWRQQVYTELAQDLPKQSTRQATFKRAKGNLISDSKVLEDGDYSVTL